MTDKPRKLGLGDPNRPKFDASKLGQPSFQRVGDAQQQAEQPPQQPPQQPQPQQPAMQGQMPLPVGHVVTPASLTPDERAALEALGWREGQAVPGNLPELLSQEELVAGQSASNLGQLPPPADPTKVPPLQMPAEQSIDDLSPERQQQIRQALDEAQQIAARGDQPFSPAGEGVGEAAAGVVHKQVDLSPEVVDDRNAPEYSSGESKAQHRAPEPDATGHVRGESMTGLREPGPKNCPHCNWDLSMGDPVDPEPGDKQSFLQALLGGVPWQRAYQLLGGQMTVTARQLAPYEVDACYQQCFYERDQGQIENQLDFWEQLTRYRGCLQLVDLRSGDQLHPFPESLKDWGGSPEGGNPTTLPQIMAQIQEQVVKTESVQRIISTTVARFNRLCAKLEANVDNPDFWEATESPT